MSIIALLSTVGASAADQANGPLVVDTTADFNGTCDDGDCSLREAMGAANARTGDDTITFAIPGPGTHVLNLESDLPAISDQVTIDASTQSGYGSNPSGKPAPAVELDGSSATQKDYGFQFNVGAEGSVVRGFAIHGFHVADVVSSAPNVTIERNYIGLTAAGTPGVCTPFACGFGIWLSSADANRVSDNVVAASTNAEQTIFGSGDDLVIAGNFVGTAPDGATRIAEYPSGGAVEIFSSSRVQIGGLNTDAKASCAGQCNLVVGRGVWVHLGAARNTSVIVSGNFIGTDVRGATALGSSSVGIDVEDSDGVRIGGQTAAEGNVVAGISSGGDAIRLANVTESTVEGNFVGTDATGSYALANFGAGILVGGAARGVTIGGSPPQAACSGSCNLVAGNVTGVVIGLNSGNTLTDVAVRGNFVGTDASGTAAIPNRGNGIFALAGPVAVEENRIAFNEGAGVAVGGGSVTSGPPVGVHIRANQIFANATLGIDLEPWGVNGNDDEDVDTGPNERQNYPVIEDIRVEGGTTTFTWSLDTNPQVTPQTYEVEFFRNAAVDGFTSTACDPSGFGEGLTPITPRRSVTVGGSGKTSSTESLPFALGRHEMITATATDVAGNTSEFSECRADLEITKSDEPDPVAAGQDLTYTLRVDNHGPAPAPIVFLRDVLPDPSRAAFVSATPSQGDCASPPPLAPTDLRCNLGEIGRDDSAIVTVVVRPLFAPQTLSNSACVQDSHELPFSCPQFLRHDYVPGNNRDTEDTTVSNPANGRITLREATLPAGDTALFQFSGALSGSIGDGQQLSANVAAGSHSVQQTLPAGWDVSAVVCDDALSVSPSNGDPATASATFRIEPGESVECTFTNAKRGTIVVEKATVPAGAPGSFAFVGDAAGSIAAGGRIVAGNLSSNRAFGATGLYSSIEADPRSEFDLSRISCSDSTALTPSGGDVSTRTATFRLDPGETITCVFTNTQRGSVSLRKMVSGLQPSGSQTFDFQLRQGASPVSDGAVVATGTANTANLGAFTFVGNGVMTSTDKFPAGTYQLCEVVMPGWRTSLATTFVPNSLANPDVDNSAVCTNFTLAAGEQRLFVVNNTPPPGGLARTIGFWKNWSSCSDSSGKQKPVLDQTLALAGSIAIGKLTVKTCKTAVSILNKTDLKTGAKMASDPAYNLAAQLLAAKLNAVAKATTCSLQTSAVGDGQSLLAAINFTGTGAYGKKMTPAQKNQANDLAATLDRYNNNLLC